MTVSRVNTTHTHYVLTHPQHSHSPHIDDLHTHWPTTLLCSILFVCLCFFLFWFLILFSLYFTFWLPFAAHGFHACTVRVRTAFVRACRSAVPISVCVFVSCMSTYYVFCFCFVCNLFCFLFMFTFFTSVAATAFALACTVRVRAACIRAISVCVLVMCRVWMRSTTFVYVIFIFHLILFLFYFYFYSFCSQPPFLRLYCSRSHRVCACMRRRSAVSLCVCL